MTGLLFKDEAFAVTGAAMEVHRTLGWGFLENVYQTALSHELTLRNIPLHHKCIYLFSTKTFWWESM